MSESIYVMSCGCKIDKDSRVIPPKTHTRNGCPYHADGRTDHRILICDCGTTLKLSMLCGCTFQRDELAHIRLRLVCPEHLEGVAHKNYICIKCGKPCTVSKMVKEAKYCDICAKKVATERSRRQTINRRKTPYVPLALKKKFKEAASRTYNCPSREKCLDKAPELSEYLPCYGCDEYPMAIALSQIRVHGGDYERRVSA